MINYIAKGEKVGNELNALYKSVVGHPSEDDNPTTICILKSVAVKRDLGQC